MYFQSKVTHETVETTALKSTVDVNLVEKKNRESNKSKESEITYIEELISKNSELKDLILKVNYSHFLTITYLVKNMYVPMFVFIYLYVYI